LEKMAKWFRKVRRLLFSLWLKPQLAHLGHGSRITPPFLASEAKGIWIGAGVTIREYAWIISKCPSEREASIFIGDGTYIGRFAHISALKEVWIEENVMIGDRVFIGDETHVYADKILPIIHQGTKFQGPVVLKSGCWLGDGAVVLPGVTIGRNAVVAANAVVTKDVPDFGMAATPPLRRC